MALPPLRLADLNVGSAIAEEQGGRTKGAKPLVPTSYFHRFIQDMNRRISASVADLTQLIEDIQLLTADLALQQLQLEAQQDYLEALSLWAGQAVFYLSGDAGVVSATPNGSGDVAIFHNFGTDPGTLGACRAFPTGTTAFHVQMLSVDADYLNVRLFDMAGSPITTGTWPIAWQISVFPVPPFVPPTP